MGEHAPQAVEIKCPGCSAYFRIKPKKGRLPEGSIPCPKCFVDIPIVAHSSASPAAPSPASPATGPAVASKQPGLPSGFERERTRIASLPEGSLAPPRDAGLGGGAGVPADGVPADDDPLRHLEALAQGLDGQPAHSTFLGMANRGDDRRIGPSTTLGNTASVSAEVVDGMKWSFDDEGDDAAIDAAGSQTRPSPEMLGKKKRSETSGVGWPAVTGGDATVERTNIHKRETSENDTVDAPDDAPAGPRPNEPGAPGVVRPRGPRTFSVGDILSEPSEPERNAALPRPSPDPTAGSAPQKPALAKLFKKVQQQKKQQQGGDAPPAGAAIFAPAGGSARKAAARKTPPPAASPGAPGTTEPSINARTTRPEIVVPDVGPFDPVRTRVFDPPTIAAARARSASAGDVDESVFERATLPSISEASEHDGLFKNAPGPAAHADVDLPPIKVDRSKPTTQSMLARLRQLKATASSDQPSPEGPSSSNPSSSNPSSSSPSPAVGAVSQATGAMLGAASESRGSGFIRLATAEIQQVLGRGTYRLRIENTVYEPVDRDGITALIRRGVLLGAEEIAEYDGDWMPITEHPHFEELRRKMAAEAQTVLSRIAPSRVVSDADTELPAPRAAAVMGRVAPKRAEPDLPARAMPRSERPTMPAGAAPDEPLSAPVAEDGDLFDELSGLVELPDEGPPAPPEVDFALVDSEAEHTPGVEAAPPVVAAEAEAPETSEPEALAPADPQPEAPAPEVDAPAPGAPVTSAPVTSAPVASTEATPAPATSAQDEPEREASLAFDSEVLDAAPPARGSMKRLGLLVGVLAIAAAAAALSYTGVLSDLLGTNTAAVAVATTPTKAPPASAAQPDEAVAKAPVAASDEPAPDEAAPHEPAPHEGVAEQGGGDEGAPGEAVAQEEAAGATADDAPAPAAMPAAMPAASSRARSATYATWAAGPRTAELTKGAATALLSSGAYREAREVAAYGLAHHAGDDAFGALFATSIEQDQALRDNTPVDALAGTSAVRAQPVGKRLELVIEVGGAPRFVFKPLQRGFEDVWRAEVASYRFCELVVCHFEVPLTVVGKIGRGDLEARFAGALDGHEALASTLVWQKDDAGAEYLVGALQEFVGEGAPWPIEYTTLWRDWLSPGTDAAALEQPLDAAHERIATLGDGTFHAAVLAERGDLTTAALARQVSSMIVFDFLTNNWERFANSVADYGARTRLVDGRLVSPANGPAFQPRASRRVLGRFEWTGRFSRTTVASIRALTPELADDVLFASPSGVERAKLNVLWSQRRELLARIDDLASKQGADTVLFFE